MSKSLMIKNLRKKLTYHDGHQKFRPEIFSRGKSQLRVLIGLAFFLKNRQSEAGSD